MKVYIADKGDRSVGINPMEIYIDINISLPNSKDREDTRRV